MNNKEPIKYGISVESERVHIKLIERFRRGVARIIFGAAGGLDQNYIKEGEENG